MLYDNRIVFVVKEIESLEKNIELLQLTDKIYRIRSSVSIIFFFKKTKEGCHSRLGYLILSQQKYNYSLLCNCSSN